MPMAEMLAPARAGRARLWGGLAAAFLLLAFLANAFVSLRAALPPRADLHDAGVYMRAGWAIAAGENPYRVADAHGWHYHYAPLLAILFVPFADPPPEAVPAPGEAFLPAVVSFALWYGIGTILLLAAVLMLAGAVESGWDAEGRIRPPPDWRFCQSTTVSQSF
jgi:hypothetical protein